MTQNKRKKVIGVTGGVGSGKSVVMKMLSEEFGARVILADLVGHDLMEPGAVSYRQIVDAFGEEILGEGGRIDRPSLSAIVFSDSEKLALLNQITHPNIKAEIIRRIEEGQNAQEASMIAVEAALLIEEDYGSLFDEMWYVYVDAETRMKRLADGRGYSEEKSRSIMRKQLSDEMFFASCQRVINNSTDVERTRQQVEQALLELEILEKDH